MTRLLQTFLFAIFLSFVNANAQDEPTRADNTDTNKTEVVEPVIIDEAQPIRVEEPKTDEWEDERAERRHERHSKPPIVRIRGDVVVPAGEVWGDIVVIAGKLKVDGEVNSVVAVASETEINGYVHDSVVIVPGPVHFGPKAEIRKDAIVVGAYTKDRGAKFSREFVPVEIPEMVPVISGVKDYVFQGLLMFRPLPPRVEWVWWVHIGMFLGLLGLTLLFPKPVRIGAETIADRPVMSMFSGFLTILLFAPVLALISVTIIGLPVAIMALILSALFGKASVMTFLGQQIGRSLNLNLLQSPWVAMIVGALVLMALYMVPIVGMLVWGVATLLGIGAMMVATASALNNRPTVATPTTYPDGTVPVQPIAPASNVPPTAETPMAETTVLATAAPVFRRVGFWKRTLAAILDLLLLSIPMALTQGFAPLLLIAYFVGMWTWKGTSIGKICLGLKIVRVDGTPIDFAVALVRSLASCFSFAVFLLGFFWAGWDKEKQSWHDKIAGTIVVQVPKGVSLL